MRAALPAVAVAPTIADLQERMREHAKRRPALLDHRVVRKYLNEDPEALALRDAHNAEVAAWEQEQARLLALQGEAERPKREAEERERVARDRARKRTRRSFGDVKADLLRPFEWWVKGLIPSRALTILAALPGAGKSLFLACLCAASRGADCVEGLQVRQGPILYYALERAGTVVRYLAMFGAPDDEDTIVVTNAELRGDVVAAMRLDLEGYQPVAVILDTFGLAAQVNDNDRYAEAVRFLASQVQPLAEEFNCAIVVVDHTTKSGTEGAGGTVGKSGSANHCLTLSRREGSPIVRVTRDYKSDVALSPECLEAVALRLDGNRLVVVTDETPAEAEPLTWEDEKRAAVVAYVARHRGAGTTAIRKAVGGNAKKLGDLIDSLARSGVLEPEGDGYTLPAGADAEEEAPF